MTSRRQGYLEAQAGWETWDYTAARDQGWRLQFWQHPIMARIVRHSQVPGHCSRFGSREEAEAWVFKNAADGDPISMKAVRILLKLRLDV